MLGDKNAAAEGVKNVVLVHGGFVEESVLR